MILLQSTIVSIYNIPIGSMYGIYLHLVDFYGKCRYLNTPYMDPMEYIHIYI